MYDAMKDGSIDGMQTFDLELEKMIRKGTITRENGLLYASNANNLALSISDLDGAAPKQQEIILEAEAQPTKTSSPDPAATIEGFER